MSTRYHEPLQGGVFYFSIANLESIFTAEDLP